MKKTWNMKDLIDLQFFLKLDEDLRHRGDEAALAKRDRVIYLAKIEPQLGKADDIPPRILVHKWLAVRRLHYLREQECKAMPCPGTLWRELTFLCQLLFFFCGLFGGFALAGSLLLYSGTIPLNVSVYFGVFVALQLGLLVLQALLFGYRYLRQIPMEATAVYLLAGRLLLRGLDAIRRRTHRTMTGRQRLNLAALVGGIRQRKELAVLLIWPVFILVQLGGLGFNLGVIGATLAKVAFSDIAFAWQSSLQPSTALVADLVRWIALPWSWLVPQAYPSLAQIEGSQMVLKEGLAHLATGDLISWWPFLCFSVLIYGFLPRCLLVVLGMVQQRRALDGLHFSSPDIRSLVRRMTVPLVNTSGIPGTVRSEASLSTEPESVPAAPASSAFSLSEQGSALEGDQGDRFCLLIPDDFFEDCPQAPLLALLHSRFGPGPIQWIRHGVPGVAEAETLAPLVAAAEAGRLAGVLLLQEAWQPPLKETETFLRELRHLAGERTALTILLIGRPSPQTILTPPGSEQLRVWMLKIRALGDPSLEVQSLVQA